MEVLQNFQKFRVLWHRHTELRSSGRILNTMYPSPGYCGTGLTELTEVPGTGMKVLHNFQNFRVLWHGRTDKHAVPVPRVFVAPACKTSTSSGYGYECPTEVTEVICVPYGQNEYRKFGYECECRIELIDVPGNGRVVQNLQKARVRVIPGEYPP